MAKLDSDGELDAVDLGSGGYGMSQPILVCIYRADHGGFAVATARPGGTVRLPWNPLARWS